MKIKLAGVFMAFLFCITMLGGSFAASPQVVTSKLSTLHYDTKITGLKDSYDVKINQTVEMSVILKEKVAGCWDQVPNRTIHFDVINDKGEVIQQIAEDSSFWTATATTKIDTSSKLYKPGKYQVKVHFDGEKYCSSILNPCDTYTTLTINN
jgi:hypothetical protein